MEKTPFPEVVREITLTAAWYCRDQSAQGTGPSPQHKEGCGEQHLQGEGVKNSLSLHSNSKGSLKITHQGKHSNL